MNVSLAKPRPQASTSVNRPQGQDSAQSSRRVTEVAQDRHLALHIPKAIPLRGVATHCAPMFGRLAVALMIILSSSGTDEHIVTVGCLDARPPRPGSSPKEEGGGPGLPPSRISKLNLALHASYYRPCPSPFGQQYLV